MFFKQVSQPPTTSYHSFYRWSPLLPLSSYNSIHPSIPAHPPTHPQQLLEVCVYVFTTSPTAEAEVAAEEEEEEEEEELLKRCRRAPE